jgi:hypothetical protein
MAIRETTSPTSTPAVPDGVPLQLRPVAPALWRVLDRRGVVIGHVQAVAQAGGTRYRARVFQVSSRAFLDLGEFWSAPDALDCLRFAR